MMPILKIKLKDRTAIYQILKKIKVRIKEEILILIPVEAERDKIVFLKPEKLI